MVLWYMVSDSIHGLQPWQYIAKNTVLSKTLQHLCIIHRYVKFSSSWCSWSLILSHHYWQFWLLTLLKKINWIVARVQVLSLMLHVSSLWPFLITVIIHLILLLKVFIYLSGFFYSADVMYSGTKMCLDSPP